MREWHILPIEDTIFVNWFVGFKHYLSVLHREQALLSKFLLTSILIFKLMWLPFLLTLACTHSLCVGLSDGTRVRAHTKVEMVLIKITGRPWLEPVTHARKRRPNRLRACLSFQKYYNMVSVEAYNSAPFSFSLTWIDGPLNPQKFWHEVPSRVALISGLLRGRPLRKRGNSCPGHSVSKTHLKQGLYPQIINRRELNKRIVRDNENDCIKL